MLNSLIDSLIALRRSTNPSVYLQELTETQVKTLHVLFIEAP